MPGDRLEESLVVTVPAVMRLLLTHARPKKAWRQLTYQQYNVLYLAAEESLGQAAIARRLGVSAPVVNRLVTILADAGLLDRHRSTADRRVVRLGLTSKGRRQVAAMRRELLEAAREILEPVATADRTMLAGALRQLDVLLPDDGSDPVLSARRA